MARPRKKNYQNILVERINVDLDTISYQNDIDGIIKYFKDIKKKLKPYETMVLNTDDYYPCTYDDYTKERLEIKTYRTETDKEYNERIAQTKRDNKEREEKQAEYIIQQLERMGKNTKDMVKERIENL